MLASAPNSEIIRVVIILAFFLMSVILRARKKPVPTRPAPNAGAPRANPLDSLREAMRQGAEQGRANQPQRPFPSTPPRFGESFKLESPKLENFNQPPAIQPESPVVPSLLLFALFVCLCLLAYRFFAG